MGVEGTIIPLFKPSKKVSVKPFKRGDWYLNPRLKACCTTEIFRPAYVDTEAGKSSWENFTCVLWCLNKIETCP